MFFTGVIAFFLCGVGVLNALGVDNPEGCFVLAQFTVSVNCYQFFLRPVKAGLFCPRVLATIRHSNTEQCPIWENRWAACATDIRFYSYKARHKIHRINQCLAVLFSFWHFLNPRELFRIVRALYRLDSCAFLIPSFEDDFTRSFSILKDSEQALRRVIGTVKHPGGFLPAEISFSLYSFLTCTFMRLTCEIVR